MAKILPSMNMKRLSQSLNYKYYAKINLTIDFPPAFASSICLSRTQTNKVFSSLLLSRIMQVKMCFSIELSALLRLIKYQKKWVKNSSTMSAQVMTMIQTSASSSHPKLILNTESYLKLLQTLNSLKILTNPFIRSLTNKVPMWNP